MELKDELIKLVETNLYLLENNKIGEYVDIIYNFYVDNDILYRNENIFYYDDEFDVHDIYDTKETIKNDISNGIYEDRFEDDEPMIYHYSHTDIIDSLLMTLEQYKVSL